MLGVIGSYTYIANRNFGSILISGASPFAGTVGGLTLTQTFSPTPFDAWVRFNIVGIQPLANAAPTGDPDGDNLDNLLEFAFGMDPLNTVLGSILYQNGSVTVPGLPAIVLDAGNFFAVFARRVSYLADSLTYKVEFSADLTEWAAAVNIVPTPSQTPVATNGVIEAISMPFPSQISTANGPKPPHFFRVAAMQLP